MRTLVAKGTLTDVQANRFCLRAAATFVAVGGLFEVVTFLSGVSAPCALSLPLTDARLLPSHALTLVLGATLLYWVWKRGGDRTLALVGPAFARGALREKTYTPRQVRIRITTLIVVAWTGYVVMRLSMPPPPRFPGCVE